MLCMCRYHGGHAGVARSSNIVFSNGALDPWSAGGVKSVKAGGSVKAVLIAEGARHMPVIYGTCEQITAPAKPLIMSALAMTPSTHGLFDFNLS